MKKVSVKNENIVNIVLADLIYNFEKSHYHYSTNNEKKEELIQYVYAILCTMCYEKISRVKR